MQKEYDTLVDEVYHKKTDIYHGKVRDVCDIGNGLLMMNATDRQSAFDKYICQIDGKGCILNNVSAWWFNQTRHIIDNHYLHHRDNIMIVKKCIPFKLEVVVRGYLTGSTNTSLWTHYSRGERNYCGIHFPDGLVKNQKLEKNIVTPTTKDKSDKPISAEEVVKMGLMTIDEWNYVHDISLKLFEYGQKIANEKGLILVDTKYEFGKYPSNGEDNQGNIILIDELHTCDSSRYWLLSSFQERFEKKLEPERFDKDVVREWLKNQCDPYNDILPEIPIELINRVKCAYQDFEKMLLFNTK